MPADPLTPWRQVTIEFPHSATAADHERIAATHIAPAFQPTRWWFIRKGTTWRWRYHGEHDISQALTRLSTQGLIAHWCSTIYEPEVRAFGGDDATDIAHALFATDSQALLHHRPIQSSHRPTHAVLRVCALLRGAGCDYYEHGDVFTRITADRPSPRAPTNTEVDALHTLLTNQPRPDVIPPPWIDAFRDTGTHLAELANTGRLTRGLRAVLAQHALFAFNRTGIPAPHQAALARAAADAVFTRRPPTRHTRTPHLATVISVNTTDTTTNADPELLRETLVATIDGRGTFHTPAIANAFRRVPRHRFLPGVDIETAYAPQVVITQRDTHGAATSSASHPNMVAMMLEQLQAQPGHRVLEIGAATGINAALLAEIVGPTGQVTTIEIDPDLAAGARRSLTTAGYDHVQVLTHDGALGHPAGAPYDRIIVTAGAGTIPPAWVHQLAPTGRIVVPLQLHPSGLTRCCPFELVNGTLRAQTAMVCGFVPMRGESSADAGHTVTLADGITLATDTAPTIPLNPPNQPTMQRWTGITATDTAAHLDLWLATNIPPGLHFGRLSLTSEARSAHSIDPPTLRWSGAAIHDEANTLAYLTLRDNNGSEEIGITAYGPAAADLTSTVNTLLTRWAASAPEHPTIHVHPIDTPDQMPGGYRVTTPDNAVTITW